MFDFYYGNEAEQFSFLRVPKFLFTDKTFAGVSNDSKILYSFLLDRMSLSVKSGWLDEKNRVYIIFTHEEAQEVMGCGSDKCTKVFKELESIGLIVRKKRGMGKPALIYVKNFVSDIEEDDTEISDIQTSEKQDSRLPENRRQDCGKSEVKTSEKSDSRLPKNRSQESDKNGVIKTDKIKTDFTETEFNQSYQSIPPEPPEKIPIDEIDGKSPKEKSTDRNYWLSFAMEKVDYGELRKNTADTGLAEEIVNIIADVLCGLRKVYVSGQAVPAEVAAKRFMQLTYEHIVYVIDSLSNVPNSIAKPDAYICTALYNATYTLSISTFAGFTAQTGLPLIG